MSALLDAADVLRVLAGEASSWEGVWEVHPDKPGRVIEIKGDGWDDAIVASCIDYSGNENGGRKAAYIATMRPPVAEGLADLLDEIRKHVDSHDCEARCEYPDGCDMRKRAERLAEHILRAAR